MDISISPPPPLQLMYEGYARSLSLSPHLPRIIQPALDHRRINPTGRNGIDPRPAVQPNNLILDPPHQAILQPRLARRILGVSRLAELAGLAARHHDGQVLQLAAQRVLRIASGAQEVLDGEEGAADVGAVRPLPQVQGQVPDGVLAALVRDAGVGDEDVDGAEASPGLLEAGADRFLVGDVAGHGVQAGMLLAVLEGGLDGTEVVRGDVASLVYMRWC